jgi:hypothetical protein
MSADRSHLNIGLSISGSWNKYSYVNSDPINGFDPTGQDCQLVDNGSGTFILNCSVALYHNRLWLRSGASGEQRRRLRAKGKRPA